MADDNFDGADFYTCADEFDALTCTSPREAIAEWLDDMRLGGRTATAVIREQPFVKVTAYKREVVDDRWIADQTEMILQGLEERFLEDYGNEDDHDPDDHDAVNEIGDAVHDAVKRFVAASTVWRCETAGTRTYSAEEVESMMRAYRPAWFETGK